MTSQIDFVILGLESAIEVLQARIRELRGEAHTTYTGYKAPKETPAVGKRRGRKPGTIMSAAARERIRAAQVRRWKLVAEQAKQKQRQQKADEARMVAAEGVESEPEAAAETAVAVGQTSLPQETPPALEETQTRPRRGRPPARAGKGGKRGD